MTKPVDNVLRRSVSVLLLCLVGCGSAPKSSSLPGQQLSGEVTARADGFRERPDWAEPNQLWTRTGERLAVVGYVSVPADKRIDMAYRVADSYARAELLRFITTRVVAVLTDVQSTAGGKRLSERIEDSARAIIDDWPVVAHYWEKRKRGGDQRMHVFARIEVDRAMVGDLLQKAAAGATEPTRESRDLITRLNGNWGKLVETATQSSEEWAVPAGVTIPDWAKAGDRETSDGFVFVCRGVAEDENRAKTLAMARCSEKLCRLFGVQIKAKTRVVENLEGLTAQSEVSEQCEDVRVVGRQTTKRGGECANSECVFWVQQSYSQQAFEEEKRRLEQPTVIRESVVIKEGDKTYRDPKVCEERLTEYGKVKGISAKSYETRRQALLGALKNCQGIDNRDSGLFMSLNTLLVTPFPKFLCGPGGNDTATDGECRYFYATQDWRRSLDTQRFLTERIQSVLKVTTDAILPMRLFGLLRREQSKEPPVTEAEVDAVASELVGFPFTDEPARPSHTENLHRDMVRLMPAHKVPYSKRYGDFLLSKVERGEVTCEDGAVRASEVEEYLASDGQLDERDWRALVNMLQRAPFIPMSSCFSNLLEGRLDPHTRAARITEVTELILSGRIRLRKSPKNKSGESNLGLLDSWLTRLERPEMLDIYLRYRTQFTGTDAQRESLAAMVMAKNFNPNANTFVGALTDDYLPTCEAMPRQVAAVIARAPEMKPEDTGLCDCLALPRLSVAAQSLAREIWSKHAKRDCRFVTNRD
jgi:hypothetical protein